MMMDFMQMIDDSESTQISILESPQMRRQDDMLQVRRDNNQRTRETVVKFPQDPCVLSVVVDVVINREDITEEDRAALWFSNKDYNKLKAEARMEGMACERDGSTKLLDGVFAERSKTSQESIIQWVNSNSGRERRGLERMANQRMASIRQQQQFQTVMEVLRAHDELQIGRGGADPEAVRRVSEKATRVARHFARMIGKADAQAVNADEGSGTRSQPSNRDTEQATKRISTGSKSSSSSKRLSDGTNSAASTRSKSQKDMKPNKKEKVKKGSDKEKKEKDKEKDKERSKSKDKDAKDKVKGKDKEKEKTRSTLKQKFKDTKAGIIARIPRIA